MKFGVILAVLVIALTALTAVEAADQGEVDLKIKARAVSLMNIERAASDLVDIRVTRWSTEAEREALVKILVDEGNHAVAAALANEAEAGWASFDPRGGSGSGRDPRKKALRYAREIIDGNTRELIMITNEYIGYGSRAQAKDGSKITEYPLSFILIKF